MEQARWTAEDQARVAKRKEATNLSKAREKAQLEAILKAAIRKGLLPKKRPKPAS